jgi:hypothetical protein
MFFVQNRPSSGHTYNIQKEGKLFMLPFDLTSFTVFFMINCKIVLVDNMELMIIDYYIIGYV